MQRGGGMSEIHDDMMEAMQCEALGTKGACRRWVD